MVVVAAEGGVVIVVDDNGGDPGDKDAVCRLRILVEVRAVLVAGVLAADTEGLIRLYGKLIKQSNKVG